MADNQWNVALGKRHFSWTTVGVCYWFMFGGALTRLLPAIELRDHRSLTSVLISPTYHEGEAKNRSLSKALNKLQTNWANQAKSWPGKAFSSSIWYRL